MGDPIRLTMLKAVAEEIRAKDILTEFRESGDVLLTGLRELEVYNYTTRIPMGQLSIISVASLFHGLIS